MASATFCQKRIQCDNGQFLTSINLADKLKAQKTTLLGTIRKHRKEIPKVETMLKSKPLYSTVVYQSPFNTTLTIYKAKKAKLVYLLSSTRKTVCIGETHKKKLPKTIKYYNLSKVGVDVLDQMARYHICKSATRRWPVAVFFNIIDCACRNAFIIYREVTGHRLSRREFLLQLIKEMCCNPPPVTAPSTLHGMAVASSSQASRKRKQCQFEQCGNKSSRSCYRCNKTCCGNHISAIVTIATCFSCGSASA